MQRWPELIGPALLIVNKSEKILTPNNGENTWSGHGDTNEYLIRFFSRASESCGLRIDVIQDARHGTSIYRKRNTNRTGNKCHQEPIHDSPFSMSLQLLISIQLN